MRRAESSPRPPSSRPKGPGPVVPVLPTAAAGKRAPQARAPQAASHRGARKELHSPRGRRSKRGNGSAARSLLSPLNSDAGRRGGRVAGLQRSTGSPPARGPRRRPLTSARRPGSRHAARGRPGVCGRKCGSGAARGARAGRGPGRGSAGGGGGAGPQLGILTFHLAAWALLTFPSFAVPDLLLRGT